MRKELVLPPSLQCLYHFSSVMLNFNALFYLHAPRAAHPFFHMPPHLSPCNDDSCRAPDPRSSSQHGTVYPSDSLDVARKEWFLVLHPNRVTFANSDVDVGRGDCVDTRAIHFAESYMCGL